MFLQATPDSVDPKQQTFFYWVIYNSGVCLILGVPESMELDACSPDASVTCHSVAEPEPAQLVSESNLAPLATLQFAKTRKLSVERSDPRNAQTCYGRCSSQRGEATKSLQPEVVAMKQEEIQETPSMGFDEQWWSNHADEVIEMCKAYD
ncbi:hypothetical protein L1987_13506 [Smallanthus sonchifolius]|uniref:Uncharacterized protein n=1 Tax=Smallanthus sonchifolius TaxID=185202 RepID=A0ACB9JIZ1_9ASTR|nr:hypothetical protein L1987_13506 [Smallanthus sonchifolius]